MLGMLAKPNPSFKRFRCVTPMWDNTARRTTGAHIYQGSTPKLYEAWLLEVARQTIQRFRPEERIVFINAWNEWAEGCHLEPDLKWGLQYLEATRMALEHAAESSEVSSEGIFMPARSDSKVKRFYWNARAFITEQLDLLNNILRRHS